MRKNILFITICIISIASITVLASKSLTINNANIEKNITNTINKKSTEGNNKDLENENILFLGDSIFDWYRTDKILDDFQVVNSGVAGNKTTDILKDMEERVYIYNPTKVFILIGTNDIEWEDSDELNEEVYNNIIEIVKKINKNRRKSKVYILSILPVNNNMKGAHDRHNSEIKTINNKLKEYCQKNKKTIYIDAFSKMLDNDGMLYEGYTKDGLHPNDLGYAKMTEIIMKYIYN